MKRSTVTLLLLVGSAITLSAAAQDPKTLFRPLSGEREMAVRTLAPPPGPHVVRRRAAEVDFTAIAAMQPLLMNLFDDVSVTVDGTRFRRRGDVYELGTRLPARRWGQVTIGAAGGALRATVHLDGKVYEVRPAGSGVVIDEIDASKLPPIDPPVTPQRPGDVTKAPSASPRPADDDEVPNLTVLAVNPGPSDVCTPDRLNAQAAHLQANLNVAFSFDQQAIATATVSSVCINHTPVGGDLQADLNWVTRDRTVSLVRNSNFADLVTFLVPSSPTLCGLAWLNTGLNKASGFSAVVESCATATFALAHEIGHNLGMRHDRVTENDFSSSACNFGYCNSTVATIMAYTSACPGTTQVGVYSTPRSERIGVVDVGPFGNPCNVPPIDFRFYRASNQQTLIDSAPVVAAWY